MASASNLSILRPQARPEVVSLLEDALARAKAGQLQDVVLVASIVDSAGPAYFRVADFLDRWRILGALEYAKDSIHRADE